MGSPIVLWSSFLTSQKGSHALISTNKNASFVTEDQTQPRDWLIANLQLSCPYLSVSGPKGIHKCFKYYIYQFVTGLTSWSRNLIKVLIFTRSELSEIYLFLTSQDCNLVEQMDRGI